MSDGPIRPPGVRVVFELKRDAEPSVVLNNLYKRGGLQTSFAGNLMAVLDGGRLPEQLTLRRALEQFIEFRVLTVQRRAAYELRRAEARLHLVDGLLLALARLDDVIAAIRSATAAGEARQLLQSSAFGLSDEQAEAVLALPLRRLSALEEQTLTDEGTTLRGTIGELNALLGERANVLSKISAELGELKGTYGTPRRSTIEEATAELSDLELTAREECLILRTARGFVKRLPLDQFDAQNRGTRGKAGVTNLSDDDAVLEMFLCSSHDTLLAISAKGVAYALPAYKVPTTSRVARGTSLMQLLPLEADEDFAATKLLPVRSFSASVYLLLLTSAGWIKKTPIEAFAKIRASGLTALKFTSEGDTVYRAALCAEGDSVVLASRLGQTLRFQCDEKQLRASGRTSRGVKSMVLRDGDAIVDMAVIDSDSGSGKGKQRLLSVTDEGYGKRVLVSQFLPKGRGGKGMIGLKFKNDNDRLAALRVVQDGDQVALVTQQGTVVRQAVRAVSQQSRAATGVQLQKLDQDDIVASITIIPASVAIEEQRKAEAIEEAEIAGEGDAAAAEGEDAAAAADEPEG